MANLEALSVITCRIQSDNNVLYYEQALFICECGGSNLEHKQTSQKSMKTVSILTATERLCKLLYLLCVPAKITNTVIHKSTRAGKMWRDV